MTKHRRPTALSKLRTELTMARDLNVKQVRVITNYERERISWSEKVDEAQKRMEDAESKMLIAKDRVTRVETEKVLIRKGMRRQILTLERQVARLEGYVDRIRETDRAQRGPICETITTTTSRDGNAMTMAGSEFLGQALTDSETKHWLDI